jgi:hypothetical protein
MIDSKNFEFTKPHFTEIRPLAISKIRGLFQHAILLFQT